MQVGNSTTLGKVHIRETLAQKFDEIANILRELCVETLPSVPIVDLDVALQLPAATSAVYFLLRPDGEILYVGKAVNLRGRWRSEWHIGQSKWIPTHGCHQPALELGNVRIAWFELPKHLLTVAESVLLRIHSPPWNVKGA